jgi:hypothetical protein
MDVGNFLGSLVGPAAREVQQTLKPFNPVIDTVRTPFPVISDISEAVGKGPVDLLTLLELQNCPDESASGRPCPRTKLIRNILDLIGFIESIPTDGGPILIPLGPPADTDGDGTNSPGEFEVDLAQVKKGTSSPDSSGKLIDFSKAKSSKSAKLVAGRVPGNGRAFGVNGLSFPFLDNSTQVFALLMGQDVVLVRYDAGTLQATAGFSYNYGPFLVGPVPVSVGLGGSATLQARFAMGYDTSGVRKTLDGGSGIALIDGIFIDDLDANGCDVPEIALIGRVYAQAGVDLGVAAAGLRGGVDMTTEINLDDGPELDGKLKIEEIANKIHNPLCLFQLDGRLEAFLGAWVRVGVEWFSKEWDIEFVRVTLLEFQVECNPPDPVLAATSSNRIVLNVGSLARNRGVQPNSKNEKIVVRQTGTRSRHRFRPDTDLRPQWRLLHSGLGARDDPHRRRRRRRRHLDGGRHSA